MYLAPTDDFLIDVARDLQDFIQENDITHLKPKFEALREALDREMGITLLTRGNQHLYKLSSGIQTHES
ncbi:hypothetical protein LHP98_19185 [Rhodobacter sp. Har01]|uniref:hypothetical protein n=1 Tax=Rhodobacter sp. Har01 TaxID=2883999 RepID=UPI001D085A90|nr:hypothetical protein [Rhodobacter sp. Har01]MCB6180233.1 hypothetical protein [Rhodobacter sp. Har01]